MKSWTKKDIEALQQKAKIRGFKISPSKAGAPIAKKASPQKDWIALNLQYWCDQRSVKLESELKFAHERKFRFDWAIPDLMIAIEYEGIYSAKSRHTTNTGFNRDVEKYNMAAQKGWTVLRFTANNYKTLISELNKCTI